MDRRKTSTVLFGVGVIIWLCAIFAGALIGHNFGLIGSGVAIVIFISIVIMHALPESAARGS